MGRGGGGWRRLEPRFGAASTSLMTTRQVRSGDRGIARPVGSEGGLAGGLWMSGPVVDRPTVTASRPIGDQATPISMGFPGSQPTGNHFTECDVWSDVRCDCPYLSDRGVFHSDGEGERDARPPLPTEDVLLWCRGDVWRGAGEGVSYGSRR